MGIGKNSRDTRQSSIAVAAMPENRHGGFFPADTDKRRKNGKIRISVS